MYISNQPGLLDKLVVTVLQPLLQYLTSIASGTQTKDSLRTVIKEMPPQVILGAFIDSVESASATMSDAGTTMNVGNIVLQIVLSGSMA